MTYQDGRTITINERSCVDMCYFALRFKGVGGIREAFTIVVVVVVVVRRPPFGGVRAFRTNLEQIEKILPHRGRVSLPLSPPLGPQEYYTRIRSFVPVAPFSAPGPKKDTFFSDLFFVFCLIGFVPPFGSHFGAKMEVKSTRNRLRHKKYDCCKIVLPPKE